MNPWYSLRFAMITGIQLNRKHFKQAQSLLMFCTIPMHNIRVRYKIILRIIIHRVRRPFNYLQNTLKIELLKLVKVPTRYCGGDIKITELNTLPAVTICIQYKHNIFIYYIK
jgi:hypothetical protein